MRSAPFGAPIGRVPAVVPDQRADSQEREEQHVSQNYVGGDRPIDVVREPVVVQQPVVQQPVLVETGRTVRRSWGTFSAGQFIHGACGLFLVIFGAVAVGRAGFDEIGTTTTDVLGITVTAAIGAVAVIVGLLLMFAALSPAGRGFGGFLGVLLLVGGIVIAAGSDGLLSDLHTESSLGWIGIIVGALAMIGAFLPAHFVARDTSVRAV
jgi:hypothetical protein